MSSHAELILALIVAAALVVQIVLWWLDIVE